MDTEKQSLLQWVIQRSQQPVQRCYQCDKCATGCPLVEKMDFSPNQLFQLMQLEAEAEVLSANTAWLCASCYTCSIRCPNEIDIAHVMDVVRTTAAERGYPSALPDFQPFHRLFLEEIQRRGRINELSLMTRWKRKPQDLLAQRKLGWAMLRKGRLKWPTPKIKDRDSLHRLFESEPER